MPSGPIILFAALYSLGAHGIMVLNDFKAVEGDRVMGIRSLPVQLGEERAAKFACFIMVLPQVIVIGLLISYERPWHAAVIAAMLLVQGFLMARLLTDPKKLAPWYNATGITLYVLGMLVSAFALQGM
jgi:chlorophyll/bacteriochlorophyll a synthase